MATQIRKARYLYQEFREYKGQRRTRGLKVLARRIIRRTAKNRCRENVRQSRPEEEECRCG